MSQLTFDLSGYCTQLIGQRFEIQIELLESFKRLHKSAPISQVLITPEFYGHAVQQDFIDSESQDEKLVNLVVVTHEKKHSQSKQKGISNFYEGISQKIGSPGVQFFGNSKINGIEYRIYSSLPDNKHIENNKIFVMQTKKEQEEDGEKTAAKSGMSPEEIKKFREQQYSKKALALTDKLEDLRKFIEEKTETEENEDGLSAEDVAAKKKLDLHRLHKTLAQIK